MLPIEPVLLENAFVRLTPLDMTHRTALQDTVAQTTPELWRFMLKNAVADFDGWFASHLEAQASGKRWTFVILDKTTGYTVGTSSLMNIEYEHDRLEIGHTWYVPAAHGTAVNPSAKLLLIRYAFEQLGCNRLELKCDALNARSRRAIAKLGATHEGILREHMKVHDLKGGTRYRDTAYYSILAAEWPQAGDGLEQRLSYFEPARQTA